MTGRGKKLYISDRIPFFSPKDYFPFMNNVNFQNTQLKGKKNKEGKKKEKDREDEITK